MIKVIRLGNTEFNLVFANFCDNYNLLESNKIKKTFTNWVYTTAGYYDKDVCQKDYYSFPADFTEKLNLFVNSMGNILFEFEDVCVLGLDIFSNKNHPLEPIISKFEEHYKIKLHGKNIDVRSTISALYYLKKCLNKKIKVLIVSPFKEIIDQQIFSGNFEKIQPSLSSFEFLTYKFPYCFLNDGPHKDSFETISIIEEEIKNFTDFDVALLSCGCYGSFLMNTICNRMNKNAIYVGGQLPLMFGIIGSRDKWAIKELYNNDTSFLINGVPDIYKPKGFEKIENGCYW